MKYICSDCQKEFEASFTVSDEVEDSLLCEECHARIVASLPPEERDDFINETSLISESSVVDFFNQRTGANCKTMEEIEGYRKQHPEASGLLHDN